MASDDEDIDKMGSVSGPDNSLGRAPAYMHVNRRFLSIFLFSAQTHFKMSVFHVVDVLGLIKHNIASLKTDFFFIHILVNFEVLQFNSIFFLSQNNWFVFILGHGRLL